MTHRQVRKIAGTPKSIRGACWYYKPVKGKVGRLSLGAPGSIAVRTADAVKLCFFSGALSSEFVQRPIPGKGLQWIPVNL
jgi:hypothetical protein